MDPILSTAAATPGLPLAVDHLVVAARSLDEGEAWLRERLLEPLAAGGAHPGFGTHNRLLRLGAGCYLELIAPDPAQAGLQGLLFGLDQPPVAEALAQQPLLLHVVLRVLAPASLAEVLPRLDYDPGVPTPMTRGDLRWLITIPSSRRPAGNGLLPTIIDWGTTPHPSTRLPPSRVRLSGLRLTAPTAIAAAFPVVRADAGNSAAGSSPLSAAAAGSAIIPVIEATSCSTICANFDVGGRSVIIESVLPYNTLAS
jgi:hypothetical protein